MKKSTKQFLFFTYIISYICFGVIAYSRVEFVQIFKDPLYIALFVLGCLGPIVSAFIVFILNVDELGSVNGFFIRFKEIKYKKAAILIPIFWVTHYGLSILLKNVYRYGNIIDFAKYFPIILLLLGSQEIGWRGIVQPSFEEKSGFWKSNIITGLFWSLLFLPLLYVPGFIVLPQFYAQFAAFLIGISILLTTLYKASGSILYCVILSSLIFALYPVIVLKQGFMLVAIAVVEAIVASMFKDKKFN